MFYLLIAVGLILRLLMIPFPGFKADMAFWKGWGLAMADKGPIWLAGYTNYNYPPGFAYILGAVNKLYAFFANPYDVTSYWAENNLLYLFMFKIIFVVCDLLVVLMIIKIGKLILKKDGFIIYVLALIYFLNPASIFDGAHWGQVDQFGLLLYLLVIYYLIKDRVELASVIFATATMMKMQNIIFIPLFYLFIWKKYSFGKLISSLKWTIVTLIVINAPYLIFKRADLLVKLMTINNNYFPFYSLYAFNAWWIASGLDGMKLTDTNLIFGTTTARSFSVLLFAMSYVLALFLVVRSKKESLIKNFILASAMVVFSFFHLLTQSHERYVYHLMGLLPLLILYEKKYRSNIIFYVLFSLTFFINIYLTMFYNYPDQIIWFWGREETRTLTLFLSISQIGIFIWFFVRFFWREIKKDKNHITVIIVITVITVITLIAKNLNFILRKPIFLTSIPPLSFSQEFSTPTYNHNLNSQGNLFAFGRVSSNYYFYKEAIASHADSEIIYNLNRQFSKFKTDYGVETEGAAITEAYFIIEGDDVELFKSEKKGRYDSPSSVEVDIKNVQRLVLKIKKIGETNYGHHADWLNPVLIR